MLKAPNSDLGKPSKKNCDYSDIVPISFYTRPPEGDRDSNYRDKINVISTPPLPPVVGTFKLKIIHLKCAKFYKLPANYSREFRVWTSPLQRCMSL